MAMMNPRVARALAELREETRLRVIVFDVDDYGDALVVLVPDDDETPPQPMLIRAARLLHAGAAN